jgi:hypothetical protein
MRDRVFGFADRGPDIGDVVHLAVKRRRDTLRLRRWKP